MSFENGCILPTNAESSTHRVFTRISGLLNTLQAQISILTQQAEREQAGNDL